MTEPDRKIGGFGYCCCLNKHTYVQFWEDAEGRQFVELEGFKSEKVDNLFVYDQREHIVAWQLVRDIENLLRELYGPLPFPS